MWVLLIICIVGIGVISILRNKKQENKVIIKVDSALLAKEKLEKAKMLKEAEERGEIVYQSQRKFHRPNCRYVNLTTTPLLVDTAKSMGLKPCKKCKPHLLQG